jgi:hypothetical protein
MGDAKEATTALFEEERELGPAACCRDLGAGISSMGGKHSPSPSRGATRMGCASQRFTPTGAKGLSEVARVWIAARVN